MKKAKKPVRKTAKNAIKKTVKKTTAKAKKIPRAKASALAESLYIGAGSDPAHAAGHKKMNIRDQFKKAGYKNKAQDEHSLNHMAASDKIKRTSSTNRRIITGAAIGKTGQIVIK